MVVPPPTPISAKFIEHIHDVLISVFLPFDEKVLPDEWRNRDCIESALGRPYLTAFGEEVWPTLPQKAAALFHSIACLHCFFNGNKRTAVIALDLFLILNRHLLTMTADEVYSLAIDTVVANQRGRAPEEVMGTLSAKIAESSVDIDLLEEGGTKERMGEEAYERVMVHVKRTMNLAANIMALNRFPSG